jgi:hypothetical protein
LRTTEHDEKPLVLHLLTEVMNTSHIFIVYENERCDNKVDLLDNVIVEESTVSLVEWCRLLANLDIQQENVRTG